MLAIIAPAAAEPAPAIAQLYQTGDYEACAAAADEAGGAENLALAARALNAAAYLAADDHDAREFANRADEFAARATEANPRLVEGHLESAIAIAERGARMAPWRAFVLGLAGRAREKLDLALELEPENPWALSTSAAWNLEVARRGGEGRFGSSSALGREQCIAALGAAPGNPIIAYECALRLLAQDRDDWRPDALAALETALGGEPADAFERAIALRAHALRAAVDEGRKAERDYIDAQP